MITQKQVKEALQKSELSQAQLARKVKISPASLSNWFAGRQELSDATRERIAEELKLTDKESGSASPEDAAAQEIMNALGMGEAPEPEPETAVKSEPEATPEPEPTQELSGDSPAELIWKLTRLPGYTLDGGSMVILLPRDSDIEGFCRNLEALDTMLDHGDIDADAHRTVCESLLACYKEV